MILGDAISTSLLSTTSNRVGDVGAVCATSGKRGLQLLLPPPLLSSITERDPIDVLCLCPRLRQLAFLFPVNDFRLPLPRVRKGGGGGGPGTVF